MIWLLLSLLTPTANAITTQQSGPTVELAAGFGLGDAPARPQLALQGHAGWWTGQYDPDFALGRYWNFGLTGRVDVRSDSVRIAPMFEVRKGMDLLVAGFYTFGSVGPLIAASNPEENASGVQTGGAARVGLGLKYRRSRFWGLTLRLEGGADVIKTSDGAMKPAGAFAVLLGGSFSRPAHKVEKFKRRE